MTAINGGMDGEMAAATGAGTEAVVEMEVGDVVVSEEPEAAGVEDEELVVDNSADIDDDAVTAPGAAAPVERGAGWTL